jgi:hypothetical protein
MGDASRTFSPFDGISHFLFFFFAPRATLVCFSFAQLAYLFEFIFHNIGFKVITMEDSSLHLKTGTQSFVTCKIQPLIVFNILEHFSRRNEGYRVIGTLVGYNNDGVIEIKNSFPVPHTEGEEVSLLSFIQSVYLCF